MIAGIFRANNLYWGGVNPNVAGVNDLRVDPLFVNPSTDAASADFRLQPPSPAGRWESFAPPGDLDGKPRPAQSSPSIGTFE